MDKEQATQLEPWKWWEKIIFVIGVSCIIGMIFYFFLFDCNGYVLIDGHTGRGGLGWDCKMQEYKLEQGDINQTVMYPYKYYLGVKK